MILHRKAKNELDMTEGPIDRLLILFAIPLIFGNLFQQLYNTVDSLVVGNFVGTEALAAVGATTSIVNTAVKFFNGVSIGAGVIISRCYGAKDRDALHRAVRTIICITAIISVIFTLLGYFGSVPMLELTRVPEDVLPHAADYLRIYFLGVTGLLFYNMGSAVLRAVGDTRRPLYFLIFSSLLNIVLDLVFVLCFGLGIAGVALATTISQFISAVMILFLLYRGRELFGLSSGRLAIDRTLAKEMFSVGLPTGLQQSLTAFSNIFVHAYINVFGAFVMAGWSCYSKIDQLIMLPMQSMGHSATTFVSQNVGAQNYGRAEKGTTTALRLAMVITFVFQVFICVFTPRLVRLFNQDPEVIRYGTLFLRLNVPFMLLACLNQVFASALRGFGDGRTPMIYLLTAQVLLRQIYLFFISRALPGNIYAVSLAFPLGWGICAALMVRHYLRLRKQRNSG